MKNVFIMLCTSLIPAGYRGTPGQIFSELIVLRIFGKISLICIFMNVAFSDRLAMVLPLLVHGGGGNRFPEGRRQCLL